MDSLVRLSLVVFKVTFIPKPWHCRHMCWGPDGYRQCPLHQDASIWPKTTDLVGTGSKKRNLVLSLRFLSVQFLINFAGRSVWRRTRHSQIHRHRNTQTEKRDCLLSLCYCDCSVVLWGGPVQKNKPEPSLLPLHSTAHRAWLLLAHKVRYEVKFILSKKKFGQLLNTIQTKLQHQWCQNLLIDQIHVHAV